MAGCAVSASERATAGQDSTFIDLHADGYVALTDFGHGRHRLSVMLTARPISGESPWWVREPSFSIALSGGPRMVAVQSKADNGQPLPNREYGLSERLAALGIPPQTHAEVTVGPLAPEAMAYVEFDFLLSAEGAAVSPVARLRMTQDFGIRRLRGAAWLEAGVRLGYRSGDSRLVMTEPEYLVNCDDAEDGDPANENYAAGEYAGYRVGLVPGARGQCGHDWCAG